MAVTDYVGDLMRRADRAEAQRDALLAAADRLCQWATVDSEGDALVRAGDVEALRAAVQQAKGGA